ncbi:MAG: pyridoxamine 5'-phosphate oxidase family protein [Geminicoccaceae bacterium]
MTKITSLEQLERRYGTPGVTSTVKEVDGLTTHYRALIEASPFLAIATSGPEGLDCSPRGEAGGVVRIVDDQTLMIPDRRGNNRVDSLRNIVRDPRVGLLFLIPGSGTTLRVNGRAELSVASELLASFAIGGREPRSVIVVHVEKVYFQCARAVVRAGLWDPSRWPDPTELPTPGAILEKLSAQKIDGDAYDRDWPARARQSLW